MVARLVTLAGPTWPDVKKQTRYYHLLIAVGGQ